MKTKLLLLLGLFLLDSSCKSTGNRRIMRPESSQQQNSLALVDDATIDEIYSKNYLINPLILENANTLQAIYINFLVNANSCGMVREQAAQEFEDALFRNNINLVPEDEGAPTEEVNAGIREEVTTQRSLPKALFWNFDALSYDLQVWAPKQSQGLALAGEAVNARNAQVSAPQETIKPKIVSNNGSANPQVTQAQKEYQNIRQIADNSTIEELANKIKTRTTMRDQASNNQTKSEYQRQLTVLERAYVVKQVQIESARNTLGSALRTAAEATKNLSELRKQLGVQSIEAEATLSEVRRSLFKSVPRTFFAAVELEINQKLAKIDTIKGKNKGNLQTLGAAAAARVLLLAPATECNFTPQLDAQLLALKTELLSKQK